MKKIAMLAAFVLLVMPYSLSASTVEELKGTWSGNWQPEGGVIDAVTVEIHEENGKLTGRFRTPVPMDYSKAEFDSKTNAVTLEAKDPKSGKLYKIQGKLNGLEIKGTLSAGETSGSMLLIKWTYVPRIR